MPGQSFGKVHLPCGAKAPAKGMFLKEKMGNSEFTAKHTNRDLQKASRSNWLGNNLYSTSPVQYN